VAVPHVVTESFILQIIAEGTGLVKARIFNTIRKSRSPKRQGCVDSLKTLAS